MISKLSLVDFFHSIEMTIGLQNTLLRTSEALGVVEVCSGVTMGMFGREITLGISTVDTGSGECAISRHYYRDCDMFSLPSYEWF